MRRTTRGSIDVIERAYDLDPSLDEKAWVTEILKALRPQLDHGLGLCAFVSDRERPFEAIAGFDLPDGWTKAMGALMASRDGARLTHPGPIAQTASGKIGKRRFAKNEAMRDEWRPRGVADGVGIIAHDGTTRVLTIAAPMAHQQVLSAPLVAHYSRLVTHIAAGWRLRDSLGKDATVDAVLAPSGKVVHAERTAREPNARQKLRDAAVAIDRARGAIRRKDEEGAVRLWRVLVDGEWSLVDRFDTDGRRYIVARKNAPTRALTLRERQVVSLISLGHHIKLISYELGVSQASVVAARKQAMLKLGVDKLSDLIQLVSAVRSPQT
jgi:DNA-binding CsgD family transcriptional regulator